MGTPPRKPPSDIGLILLLLIGLFLWQRSSFPLWMLDVFPNHWGAHCVQSGNTKDLYTPLTDFKIWGSRIDGEARSLGLDCDVAPYMYPPFVAATLSPFGNLSATAWRNAQFVLNIVLLFVFAWIIFRLCGERGSWRGFLWALALVLICYPMARATKLGQLVPLLAALTWIGLLLIRDHHDGAGGVIIGIIAAVKIFPAALIMLLLLDRRTKAAVSAAAAFVACYIGSFVFLGWDIHLRWWQALSDFGGMVIPFFGNQSLLGWFVRIGGGSVYDEMPVGSWGFFALQWILTLILAVVVIRVLWPNRGAWIRDNLALSIGLMMGAVLLTIPVSWEHYGVFLIPVVGWAVHRTWMQRDARFWELWLAVAVFFFIMKLTHFYGDSLLGRLISGSQAFGLLLLFVWFVRRASVGLSAERA